MSKYRLLREQVAQSRSIRCRLRIPPPASDAQLRHVHSADYLDRVLTGKLSDLDQRRIGFPWSPQMVERSRRSTGASIAAGRTALQQQVSCNLAGGTHHSFPDRGQGYCVFNDVCVAARTLQSEGLVQRVLFVDCDVHQGNGTAAIARQDPQLFSFSIHCDKNYPFQKITGDLDVALPENTGDSTYLAELKTALDTIFQSFVPDLVFYLAGADPFQKDRLGRLSLTKSALGQRDEMVIEGCRQRRIPVAICMAGGYAPDIQDIVDIHFSTVLIAYRSWQLANGQSRPSGGSL